MHVGCLTDIDHILVFDEGGENLEESGDVGEEWAEVQAHGVVEGGPSVFLIVIDDPEGIGVIDVIAVGEGGLFFGLEVDYLVVGGDLILRDELHDHVLVDIVALIVEDYCNPQKIHQF